MRLNRKLPLHLRNPQDPIAARDGKVVTAGQFGHTVALIAERINQRVPHGQHAINLCINRLSFFHALSAAIVAGQVNLLPPNRQPGTIAGLAQQYPGSWVLHDGHFPQVADVTSVDINQLVEGIADPAIPGAGNTQIREPHINSEQLAAVSFTSGSTGVPGANLKTWGMLLEGARVNAANMLLDAPAGLNIVATVPAQHMYGLELTITLPLAADVTMQNGQPLFPVDIVEALGHTNSPRALVTTPQHLRTLLDSGLAFPEVDIVYSATAPLDQTTAKLAESAFGGRLTEIFGCSEIGSVARRQTACESNWTLFSSMNLSQEGEQTLVQAPHVAQPVPLQDQIKIHQDGSFTLSGRLGDLINIAGKRGSFAQLNKVLLQQDNVSDGIIFNPHETGAEGSHKITRLAALVVSSNPDRALLLKQLREYIDPVFLPRTVLFCDQLPRNDNGKLPRQALLALWAELKPQS